jgi:hypothetical protein
MTALLPSHNLIPKERKKNTRQACFLLKKAKKTFLLLIDERFTIFSAK